MVALSLDAPLKEGSHSFKDEMDIMEVSVPILLHSFTQFRCKPRSARSLKTPRMSSQLVITRNMSSALRSLSLLCAFSTLSVYANVYNRYVPQMTDGAQQYLVGKKVKISIELVAKYGASQQVVDVAKRAIISHFTTVEIASGNEAHEIGTEMERAFGGFWMVGIFDSQFDVAYTITRRSPRYLLFAAGDYNILLAEELTVGARVSNSRPF
uniref:DUF4430 domain-containing protein n=1 Tax=Steinernema glaseri TaxID=37863 RepID=A0A1I7Z145_9BILA